MAETGDQQRMSSNQPAANEVGLLRVTRAAEELGVSIHTVRAWIAQRRIGHVRLGRAIRVPRSEVERLLEIGFVPAKRSL